MFFASCFWFQPHLHIQQKCVHSIKPGGCCTSHSCSPPWMLIPLPLIILFLRSAHAGISLGNRKPPFVWTSHRLLLFAHSVCVTPCDFCGYERRWCIQNACLWDEQIWGEHYRWTQNSGFRPKLPQPPDASGFHPVSLGILTCEGIKFPLLSCCL